MGDKEHRERKVGREKEKLSRAGRGAASGGGGEREAATEDGRGGAGKTRLLIRRSIKARGENERKSLVGKLRGRRKTSQGTHSLAGRRGEGDGDA